MKFTSKNQKWISKIIKIKPDLNDIRHPQATPLWGGKSTWVTHCTNVQTFSMYWSVVLIFSSHLEKKREKRDPTYPERACPLVRDRTEYSTNRAQSKMWDVMRKGQINYWVSSGQGKIGTLLEESGAPKTVHSQICLHVVSSTTIVSSLEAEPAFCLSLHPWYILNKHRLD